MVPPARKGFGCFVLERVTLHALGEGSLEFNAHGLIWTCVIKPEHLVDDSEPTETPKQAVAPSLAPQKVET